VRDFWRGASNGVQDLGWRLSGSADLYAEDGRRPYASVNFVTAHDGFTMRDLVSYDQKHNEANGEDNRDGTDDNRSANYGAEGDTADPAIVTVRQRQVRNLLTMLILSTGVPMITAGDEFGRTQGGNNNPYCQDNEISWVDWDFAPWQRDLLATAQTLISLRSKHPAFRRRYFFEGRPVDANGIKDLAWLDSTGAEFDDADWNSGETRTFGMYINGHVGHRDARGQLIVDDSFLLLFNAADHDVPFTLPGKPFGVRYRRLIDTADAKPKAAATDDTAGHTITLTARSSMVYRVEAE
jgi:glycogen operon protein